MYMYVIILYYICYIIYIILVKYVHRLQVQCGGLQQPQRRLRSRLWLAGGRWGARRNGGRVGSDLNFWCHVVHLGRNTEDRPKKDKHGPKICQFWSILMIPIQRPQDKPTIFPGFSFQFPLFFLRRCCRRWQPPMFVPIWSRRFPLRDVRGLLTKLLLCLFTGISSK